MYSVSRVVKATGLKPVGLVPPQVRVLHGVPNTPLAEWSRRLTQNQLHRGSSVRIRQGVPCPHNSTWESDGLKNHRLTVQIRLWTLNRGIV